MRRSLAEFEFDVPFSIPPHCSVHRANDKKPSYKSLIVILNTKDSDRHLIVLYDINHWLRASASILRPLTKEQAASK
jgi:hypothetical protein